MKQKNIIFALFAATSLLAGAQVANPTLSWAKNINYTGVADDVNVTNIGYNIAMAADGNLLVYADCGTVSTDNLVYFGEDLIGTGTQYGSTSYNHGMFLVKADAATGKKLWSVYSNVGESSSNQGAVVPTSDGGAYFVAKVRLTVDRGTDKINFVDATGANFTIDWTLDEASSKRYFNGLIVKVDGNGAFQWYRMITMNHDPQPNASTSYSTITPEGLYIQSAVADGDDNLYVCGRFCTAMTFDNGVTLIPQSVAEDWNGDPQKTNGDLYIVKFDTQGNYVNSLVQDGKGNAGQIFNIDYCGQDGKLYAAGYFDAIEGNAVSLGGKELTPGYTSKDLLVACLDTDLNVNWARLYPTSYGGTVYNKLTVNAIGDNLWISSKTRSNLSDGEGNSFDCSSKVRDGLLLRLNKADGSWLGATSYGTNQAGFNGVFESQDDPDSVYVYGHVLLGNLFIAKYSIDGLNAGSRWNLNNNSADIQNVTAIEGSNNLYCMTRVCKGNTTVYYDGEGTRTLTQNIGFNTLVSAFTLPVTVKRGDATKLRGDADANGTVALEDLNAIIDFMLNGDISRINFDNADCNTADGDGTIGMEDITALIDYLLSGHW